MSWDGLDRRKFPRAIYPCLLKVKLPGGDEGNILTHTENIGLGGVSIITKSNVKAFTNVGIELDLLDMGDHIQCQGRVVWNIRRKATEDKKPFFYDIGIEYLGMGPADQKRLHGILGKLAQKGAASFLKPFK